MSVLANTNNFLRQSEMATRLSAISAYKQISDLKNSGYDITAIIGDEIHMNLRKKGLIMPILARVSELTVGAIISCPQSVAKTGFVKIVATQPVQQTSHHAKWTILAAECNENGVAKNSNYFSITQEEIDRWQAK